MMNVMAHELSEAATDPLLNAWSRDIDFAEDGDLCAWHFGHTFAAPNGAFANHVLSGRHYLIQSLWINKDGGFCANQYDSQPPTFQTQGNPSPTPAPANDLLRK